MNLNIEDLIMEGKPQKLKLNYKVWIETEDHVGVLGEGKWKLLKAIRDTGSLKEAVSYMGYTYRKTWENLRSIEEKLGIKLIEKRRGGEKGGETVLTKRGEMIVDFFDKLSGEIDPLVNERFGQFLKDLNRIIE